MSSRLKKTLQWIVSHKRRTAASTLGIIVSAYSCIFLLVSCSSSPTNKQLALPDERILAYNEYAAGYTLGPQVVLLHGSPADANAWNLLVERVGEVHAGEVFVVDRIGYGNSTTKDELALAGHAASIQPLLYDVAGRKPIIVGHSYGGPVALRVAVDYPEQVGGIVLVAGACDAYMNDSQWFRRFINVIRLIVPEPWERANRELLALTDENRAMEPLLGRVVCPVYIVHGTWDGVCPHDSTIAYLRERLVNAEFVEVISLERAGHNLHRNRLDEVISAINLAADHESKVTGREDPLAMDSPGRLRRTR